MADRTEERAKHEIETPWGKVYLRLQHPVPSREDYVEFTTADGQPLVIPCKTGPPRHVDIKRYRLLRPPYEGGAWQTSTNRNYESALMADDVRNYWVAASDSKVAKVTQHLRALLPVWLESHPLEVAEAEAITALEDFELCEWLEADAKKKVEQATANTLGATARLEKAQRIAQAIRDQQLAAKDK